MVYRNDIGQWSYSFKIEEIYYLRNFTDLVFHSFKLTKVISLGEFHLYLYTLNNTSYE